MARHLEPEILAALGAYQFRAGQLAADELTGCFRRDPGIFVAGAARSGTVRCRLHPAQLPQLDLSPAAQESLKKTWEDVLQLFGSGRGGLRLGLQAYAAGEDLAKLRRRLAAAGGVGSVFIADYFLAARGPWHWPLRIGFLPDAASFELRGNTAERYRHREDLEPLELGTDAATCDLLVVPDLETLALAGPGIQAGGVLSLQPPAETLPVQWIRETAGRLEASAVAYVLDPLQDDDLGVFFKRLIDELSHDGSLDTAIAWAVGDVQGYELMAHPSFLESARASKVLGRSPGEIKWAARRARLEESWGAPTEGAGDSRGQGIDESPGLGRDSGGTGPPEEGSSLDRTVGTPEPRWLQAQVYEPTDTGWLLRRGAFRAATTHQVRVRIGPGAVDWIRADRPFDETRLPEDAPFHQLEVVLLCLQAVEKAQVLPIMLPAVTGPSTEARFDLTAPGGGELRATVLVLYENRHLQSAVLRGRVAPGPDAPDAADAIAFEPGEAAAIDFDHAGPCDLLLYHDAREVLVKRRGVAPDAVSLAGIESLVGTIRTRLYEAAWGAAQAGTGIDRGPGLDLVRMLAAQGRFLKRKLLGGDAGVSEVRHVEVVSPFSAELLPVEFFYDGEAPADDAGLCPSFASASDAPACGECRARAGTGRWVCPLGFWALNRIIQRQVRPLKPPRGGHPAVAPEPTRAQSTLKRLRRMILAASDQVAPGDLQAMLGSARAIDPEAHPAATWTDWKEWVEGHHPELLVALPHNVDSAVGFQALEIGAVDRGDRLRLDMVEQQWPSAGPPGPIVLLLGCNTAAADIPYQDFVAEIRRRGAALVVGTLTTVLGRHAAPVARELVCLLAPGQRSEEIEFGELLRRARVRILRAGNVMALAVVAYGNAGWQVPP